MFFFCCFGFSFIRGGVFLIILGGLGRSGVLWLPSWLKSLYFASNWCLLGSMGWHLGGILELFWSSRGAVGCLFWALGVPLGAFGAQPLPKTRGLFHPCPLFSDFGAKMGTKKGAKMHQKIDQKMMNF